MPWLSEPEEKVWRQLLEVHARLIARLDGELRRTHGLSLADYDVLVALSEAPDGSLRMTELAARVLVSPSGLTRRVDRMAHSGLVRRSACPSDGRGALASITPAGRGSLNQAAPTHVGGVRRYLLEPIGGSALEGLGNGLAGVERALDVGPARGPAPARSRAQGVPAARPSARARPESRHALVPPATDTAG